MMPASESRTETGYAHPDYAMALSEFGRPRSLLQSGGWVLERTIPETNSLDAMGCYPIFSCRDWSSLTNDLGELGKDMVSLVLVTDPFGDYTEDSLRETFPDVVVPFKEHFVIDLGQPLEMSVEFHHQRNARKALREIEVECISPAHNVIKEWNGLYATLIDRHSITGIAAFSPESFEKQLRVPGLIAFRASRAGHTVGINLWYARHDVGYYHLGAYNEEGYRLRASFALFWRAIEHFTAAGLQWLDLGAGAGAANDGTDGLTRFKRGWTNAVRMAYLCGRIFDRTKYYQLAKAKGVKDSNYFPAYRKGEFD